MTGLWRILHLAGIRNLLDADVVPLHELDLVLVLVVGSPANIIPETEVPVLVEEHGGDPVLLPAAVAPAVVPLEGEDAGPDLLAVPEDHQVEAEAEVGPPAGDLPDHQSLLQGLAGPLVDSHSHGLGYWGNSGDLQGAALISSLLVVSLSSVFGWISLRHSKKSNLTVH